MSRMVQYSRHGGPEVLEIVAVAEPHAADLQVRVSVRAAGLNAFDSKARSDPAMLPHRVLPAGQGSEFAGVVDEVGAGVTNLKPGDEVLGWINSGAQAEYVVVAATSVTPKPEALDWATAGAIGLVGGTAKRAVDAVAPAAGETILVSAAAGAVGLFTAQYAILAGARVIGTARATDHEFLRSLDIEPLSYGPGLLERLRAIAPGGIDAALDSAGRDTVEAALQLGVPASRINSVVYFDGKARYGISTIGAGRTTADGLAKLARLVTSGALVMPIAGTFALGNVRAAYEFFEAHHSPGKIVLTLP